MKEWVARGEFKRDTVIGVIRPFVKCNGYLISYSTVSGIITKWTQLGTTEKQPRSGEPHKITELGQHNLRRTVRRCSQFSVESIATDLQTSCGLHMNSRTMHRELHDMRFNGRAAAFKHYVTQCKARVRCCGTKPVVTGV